MKIRKGFVSNSSSSSFILRKGDAFNDTREIAKYMLNEIDWMSDYERGKYNKLLESIKEDDNITFQTTNYDTYIQYLMGYYFIDTANNHDWGSELTNSVDDLPPEFDDIIDKEYLYCGEQEFKDVKLYEANFYSLPHKVHITRIHWESDIPYKDTICKRNGHYTEKLYIDGKFYCPSCIGDVSRVLKLKKLLDK